MPRRAITTAGVVPSITSRRCSSTRSRRMAHDPDLAARVRAALADAGRVREVKMFGGIGVMLNGNMVAAASPRGLLVRVGKDRNDDALARPGARPITMRGRTIAGYVFVDPPTLGDAALADWLRLGLAHVRTLPAKPAKTRKKKGDPR